MNMQNDYLEKIEFLTLYPNTDGTKTLLATVLTTQGYRALLYAPAVDNSQMNMSTGQDIDEVRDARGIPLLRLSTMRSLKLENTAYFMKNNHNKDEEWYLKIIYLDGPQSKNHISKSALEKLLGCVIDG